MYRHIQRHLTRSVTHSMKINHYPIHQSSSSSYDYAAMMMVTTSQYHHLSSSSSRPSATTFIIKCKRPFCTSLTRSQQQQQHTNEQQQQPPHQQQQQSDSSTISIMNHDMTPTQSHHHSNSMTPSTQDNHVTQSSSAPSDTPSDTTTESSSSSLDTNDQQQDLDKKKKKRRRLVPLREPFKLTQAAANRVLDLLSHQDNAVGLKVSVNRRGCNGLTTVLDYVYSDNIPKFHEEVTDKSGVKIYVEPSALMYVIGTVMDYVDDEVRSEFVFHNPNAQSQCGCGESVSVPDKVAKTNQKAIDLFKQVSSHTLSDAADQPTIKEERHV